MSRLEHTLEIAGAAGFLFGHSKALESLNAIALEVSGTDIPVLISGASGSGKDAYAGLLHSSSPRRDAQFSKINCAMLDRGELMRRLHEAVRGGSNCLGTLYLDNLDELESDGQRVLLSVLPDAQTQRHDKEGFPRLISSSTRNLEEKLESSKFRRELYFRLNCIHLKLPSLRERKEDIAEFLEYFLRKHARNLKRNVPVVDDGTLNLLMAHDWPGNLRELENLARKMLVLGDIHLAVQDLRAGKSAPTSDMRSPSTLKEAAKAASQKAERELILEALQRTRWNRKKAARDLQISYKSLLYKIKEIGVPAGKLRDGERSS